MHFPTPTLLALLPILSLTLALPSTPTPTSTTSIDNNNSTIPDYYEAVHQAECRFADILDRKDYDSLGLVMTQDAIYDNSALPGGSVMKGLDEIKQKIVAAFGDAMVRHDVTLDKIEPLGVGRVHVIT